MEIKIRSSQILNVLHILSWILFVGICIQAGGLITNAFFMLYFGPADAQKLWQQVDLSGLYQYNPDFFFVMALVLIIVSVMKALLFYLIIAILQDKKLNMQRPFNNAVGRFIFSLSYLTLGIALFAECGTNYAEWLIGQGVEIPDTRHLELAGADVWLFMSVVLFVIAHIFKRGIEIQAENELTV